MKKNVCVHKGVFQNFNFTWVIGVILLGIFSALASAGGIGGSEIAIPLIEIFYGFEHSDTKPIA